MTDARERARARKVWWSVFLGAPLLRLLGYTWRVEEVNAEPWRALTRAGQPYLLSSWHGQLLTHVWANRFRGLCAMVSLHGDGEIISRIIMGLGFRSVRGSSSRGGREAMIGMLQELADGRSCAITPDGPRGPAGVAHPGVLNIAIRSGAPIVPIRTESSRAWHLKSWDRFQVPKPFARVRVIYGDPWLPSAADDTAMAELLTRMGPAPAPPAGA